MRFGSAHVVVIGFPSYGRFQQRALSFGLVYVSRKNRDNRACNLVLNREDILDLAVIPLGPALGAVFGIDKLNVDPDPIVLPPNAPFQQIANAKLLTYLPNVDRLALVLERRVS